MPGTGAADLTSAGLSRWRERIRREEAVNARIWKDGFSIRTCVRSRDVPVFFKPQQCSPSDVQVGLLEAASAEARELRAALDAGAAPPQQRLVWPETSQHQVGWFAQGHVRAAGGPDHRGLGLANGGIMPRTGVGWLSQVQSAEAVASPSRDVTRGLAAAPIPSLGPGAHGDNPPPPSGQAARLREAPSASVAAPPQDPQVPLVRRKPPGRRAALPPNGELPRPPPPPDPWGLAADSEAFDAVFPRPTSETQRALAEATERQKRFGNLGSPWYRPKGTCDVGEFATAYARSWGVSLFAKKHP